MRWLLVFLLVGSFTVEAKTVCVEREMECYDAVKCSRYLSKQLEATHGIQFESRGKADTVQGSVSITHGNPHVICVEVYDASAESPDGIHLRPPATPISDAELTTDIRAVPKAWTRMDGFEPRLETEIVRDTLRASARVKLRDGNPMTDAEVNALGLPK